MPGDKVVSPETTTQLPANVETYATILRRAGYATAHFGKWHAGREDPKVNGFDENDGPNSNGGPENVSEPNPTQCYATAELGMDFMTRQVKARRPFLLQISHYPGKSPESATPEMIEAVKQRLNNRIDSNRIGMAAGNEEIDKTIGLVFSKLKELGQLENTYILYTADHGAQGARPTVLSRMAKARFGKAACACRCLSPGLESSPGSSATCGRARWMSCRPFSTSQASNRCRRTWRA